ncbi:fungal-specific transcription factor domain-containing protein [Dactylonectria estremocensis]|uniref:Fungal-specific transcription factor domain-containing protein n=1 Tax=Dactylonectria estremocensis TaxID=1079267 RepID=A0A9P9EUY2_9HYPO|nr:fungal-specific transcription factor domain-containing protein [Dactylonectria estremocensis]
MDDASSTVELPREASETTPSSAATRKRAATDGFRRGKRGKYTSVACDECKKRKLKCIPVDDSSCQRCIDGGLVCVYAHGTSQTKEKNESQQLQVLSDEVSQLRKQMSELAGAMTLVRDLKDRPRSTRLDPSPAQDPSTIVVPSPAGSSQREGIPKEPQFVGPTRSAFGFIIGERSLTRMGIPTYETLPASGAQSPTNMPRELEADPQDYWHHVTAQELVRLLTVFQEEVESVYPFINIGDHASRADEILQAIRSTEPGGQRILDISDIEVSSKDIDIVKVAVATAIVLEAHGKKEISTSIVESVENNISVISRPAVDLQEVQLITMLSIYYFHCDEELLAWRTIGVAAREALEMGLHRKKSLVDNFKDLESRSLATKVFWCVYVLDRRWSFGTSLSFALVDRDIDPELPEPGEDSSYLKCMVGYGRVCSKLWDAIPSFGSHSQLIPEDTVISLDLSTQAWLQSIPPDLQLRHPRLGLAPRSQPRIMHRLRALLYLRGNHTRTLIYRHHLLSASSIAANLRSAWLVVDIAQDSIQVLVHLNSTTDIYSRQQNAFNYFLLSSLAIIFLAVCHAPDIFTGLCRKSFLDAVELVRGFSRHSIVSRRLWDSIRGLIPRLKSLGLQGSDDSQHTEVTVEGSSPAVTVTSPQMGGLGVKSHHLDGHDDLDVSDLHTDSGFGPDLDLSGSIPDMYQMRNDLLSLFDAFGNGQILPEGFGAQFYGPDDGDTVNGMGGEISRRFQGLI